MKVITSPAVARAATLEFSMDSYAEFRVRKDTRRQRVDEPGPTTFISDLQQIMPIE